tara:strand:- start:2229 stop:2420 length:192 start_codon:yes stop_codon:yes gene_type:complete
MSKKNNLEIISQEKMDELIKKREACCFGRIGNPKGIVLYKDEIYIRKSNYYIKQGEEYFRQFK